MKRRAERNCPAARIELNAMPRPTTTVIAAAIDTIAGILSVTPHLQTNEMASRTAAAKKRIQLTVGAEPIDVNRQGVEGGLGVKDGAPSGGDPPKVPVDAGVPQAPQKLEP